MAFARVRGARLIGAGLVAAAVTLTGVPALAAGTDTPITTWGTNGRVKAMVVVGSDTVIGGSFTQALDPSGHAYSAPSLALVDGVTGVVDRSWTGSTNGEVYAMAVSGSTLYIGGEFTTVDGQPHRNVAALDLNDGSLISSFSAGTNRPVDALTTFPGAVIIGGRFTSVYGSGHPAARPYLAKLDPSTGALDAAWAPNPDLRVRGLAASLDGQIVYAVGDFDTISGHSARDVAAIQGADPGALVSTFHGGPTNGTTYSPVLNLELVGSTVYLAVAGNGGACTAFSASTGARIWSVHSNGNVQTVAYLDGVVYCGGHFGGADAFGTATRYHMAGVTAAAPYTTTDFAPKVNSALGVWSLATDGSRLFLGGDFTKLTGQAHDHYAAYQLVP